MKGARIRLKSILVVLYNRLISFYQEYKNSKIADKSGNVKIFCIGSNKTGSTSLEKMFKDFNYIVGVQRKAELLVRDVLEGNIRPLIKYCQSAEVFQDAPFSFLDFYKDLDRAFPKSKFILTVRDNSEQWYNSLTNFHGKMFNNGLLPSWDVLRNDDYVQKGWIYYNTQKVFGLTENDHPYDKKTLINYYEKRNEEVIEYFKNRPNDFIIINLSNKSDYTRLCNFLGIDGLNGSFPWENKTY